MCIRDSHTTADTLDVVDRDKLQEQRDIGVELVAALATAPAAPTLTAAPLATFEDAQVILQLASQGLADLALFSPADQTTLQDIVTDLQQVVDDGAGAFDNAARTTVLLGALDLVNLLDDGPECDGFLAE